MTMEASIVMAKFNKKRSLGHGGRVALSSYIDRVQADAAEPMPEDGEPLVRWFVDLPAVDGVVELCDDIVVWWASAEIGRITTPALGDYPARVVNFAFSHKLEYPCEFAITLFPHSITIETIDADGVAETVAVAGITDALTRWICRWWKNRLAEEDE